MGKQNENVATQETTTVEAAQAATQEVTAPAAVAVAEQPVKEGLGTKIVNGAKKHKTTLICLAAAAAGVGAFILGRKFGKKDAEEDLYYRNRFDDDDEEEFDEDFDEDFDDEEDDEDGDSEESETTEE